MDNLSPHSKHLIKEWLVGPRGLKEHHEKYKMVILEFRTLFIQEQPAVAYRIRHSMWSEDLPRKLPRPELVREVTAAGDPENDE